MARYSPEPTDDSDIEILDNNNQMEDRTRVRNTQMEERTRVSNHNFALRSTHNFNNNNNSMDEKTTMGDNNNNQMDENDAPSPLDSLITSFICAICQEILCIPIFLKCGHAFCYLCVLYNLVQ